MTTTIFAHFDGKSLVLDQPVDLPVGMPLRIVVEPAMNDGEQAVQTATSPVATVTAAPRRFQPLDIQISPELSHAIALDPEFNIEES